MQLRDPEATSLYTEAATGADLRLGRKSLLAGFAGGVAGAWTMRRFSAMWRKLGGHSSAPPGEPYSSQEWESAGRTAECAAAVLLRRRLTREEKRRGAAAVHYGVGGLAAAGYAVGADVFPGLRAGAGAGFGIAFWLLGDELGMPWLGLTARPGHYPLPAQINSLGEHVVYGITAELVRRGIMRLF